MTNDESDVSEGKTRERPFLDNEIGRFPHRLKTMMGDRSVREISRLSGISSTTISDYLNGESSPNLERLGVLAEALGVSARALAFGEDSFVPDPAAIYGVSDFLFVPRLDVAASAGHGSIVDNEKERCRLAFRRDWLVREGISTNDLAVIEARGDSMEPTIGSGDLLLIDLTQRDPGAPGIFVLRTDGALLVKRLQLDLRGRVVATSDNQAYGELVASAGEIDVIGRAVWSGRRL